MALGNHSAAQSLTSNKLLEDAQADNLLEEKTAFSLSYNRTNGGPNWVNWRISNEDRGHSGRSNTFSPDPDLSVDLQIRPSDYRGSGHDRVHKCPSGDRTADADINAVTFYIWKWSFDPL